MQPTGTECAPAASDGRGRLWSNLVVAALAAGLLWAYWPTLATIARRWSTDPRYAHGYLVPAFALGLLWARRRRATESRGRPGWGGVSLIALGAGIWLAGAYLYNDWLSGIALLPCLAGLSVLWGGWRSLRWTAPSIGFLAFMVPLPYRLEIALGWPLQRLATLASTYTLQTIGLPAVGEGNIITMSAAQIGVVEACSGLSMMVLFFALSTAVAMVIRRPWLDRLAVIAAAIPIALIANIARITVTGVLHETVGTKVANIVFHDLAGWLMMPLALVLLGLELRLLSLLLVELPPKSVGPLAPVAVGPTAWIPGMPAPAGSTGCPRSAGPDQGA